MPIDISKLEKVKRLTTKVIARCPACAEIGRDKSGEHLIVWPNGAFACVAFMGDKDHRRQIARLAGDSKPRTLKVYAGRDEVLL